MESEVRWMNMETYMVNPENDDPVLFEAEEDGYLDYEENPKKGGRKGGKRRKGGKKGGKKRSYKRRKQVIKLVEAPKRRKKYHKRRKSAGKRKKSAGKRKRTYKHATLAGVTLKSKHEQNPKRRRKYSRNKRRKHRKVAAAAEANTWKKHPTLHRRARKLGWKRQRRKKAGRRKKHYEANPKRRKKYSRKRKHYQSNPRRRRRMWKAVVYRNNPSIMGILKPPTIAEIGKRPYWKTGVCMIFGAMSTGAIQMGFEWGLQKVNIPEPAKDAITVVGSLGVGSLVSFGVAKVAKDEYWGKVWQTGVYITTVVKSIGVIAKYVTRALAQDKYKLKTPLPAQPTTTTGFVAGLFGMGSILGTMNESKLVKALSSDGLVVAKGEKGQLALANAGTGDIIISGPAASMKPVIQAVNGISFQQKGSDDDGGLGEDITVES